MRLSIVEVQRASRGQSKHLNPFEVVIDGEVAGRLGPGESVAFKVVPGPHEVFARIYWCRSETVGVYLQDDQRLTFRCETRSTNVLTDGFWASLGYRRYLRLYQVESEKARTVDHDRSRAVEPAALQSSTDARKRSVPREAGQPRQIAEVMNVVRHRQPAVAVFLLLAVGIVLLALTRGFKFLAAVSVIYIGVQAVRAINFHVLTPRSALEPGVKSDEPFLFRAGQDVIFSGAFALAGIASLIGVLPSGTLGGWLALGAAAAGTANIVVTRRSATAGSVKP